MPGIPALDNITETGLPHAKPLRAVQGAQRAGENCISFQRTCCGLSYSDSAQKTPGLVKNIRLLILAHLGWWGGGQMKVSLGTEALREGSTGLLPTCEHRWLHTDRSTHCPATASCSITPPPPAGAQHTQGVTASPGPVLKLPQAPRS